ncbi:hypothetical protein HPB52_025066 [Rhipicephalus sanguineus]|uniref:Uncharacterized protein n=1 Tax=Rhipicephalus sanguineus TaxID=34632 RepID=A0A9D4PAC0_RHISA|nr:hypothetical protein HPB52_024520 [Rhipicephalus sanguineus]KAH7986306.1 hypothetical protein HPB52_025066 [Rhipicephalus sanguineus]
MVILSPTKSYSAAVSDRGTQPESETPADVNAASQDGSTYLIGFESPLRDRYVDFAQPLFDIRVCSGCGVLPHKAVELPCRHILCLCCRGKHLIETTGPTGGDDTSGEQAIPKVLCPEDWTLRSASDLRPRVLRVGRVRRQVAYCLNSVLGCSFTAELRDVEKHYPTCRYEDLPCPGRRVSIAEGDMLMQAFLCGQR